MKNLSVLTLLLFIHSILLSQAPGTPDEAFGNSGSVVTSVSNDYDRAHAVALQPDGKIIISGYTQNENYEKNILLIRYNQDGSVDDSFGIDGIVITDVIPENDDIANDLVIQEDGKIVVVGTSKEQFPSEVREGLVLRYNSDGSLDNSFAESGIKIVGIEWEYHVFQEDFIRVQIHEQSNKIIVGGNCSYDAHYPSHRRFLMRLLPNGAIDETFGNQDDAGMIFSAGSSSNLISEIRDLIIEDNGELTTLGYGETLGPPSASLSIRWLLEDGSSNLDMSTESLPGSNSIDFELNDFTRGVNLFKEDDGSYIVTGNGGPSESELGLGFAKLDQMGEVESTYPVEIVDMGNHQSANAKSSIIDLNDKIVFGGYFVTQYYESTFLLHRVNGDGTIDESFGNNGTLSPQSFNIPFLAFDSECTDIVLAEENKVIAVGWSGSDIFLVKVLGEYNVEVLEPPQNFIDANPDSVYFDWEDYENVTLFEMEIDTNATFSSNPQTYTTAESNYTLFDLEPSTEYFWRVRVIEPGVAETVTGEWSDVWQFTTGEGSVGIEEQMKEPHVTVFPNPADEKLQISCNNRFVGSDYSITDQSQRIIQTGKLTSELTTLNVGQWSRGVYYFTVRGEVIRVVLQ